jgi:hypothetical protein
VTGRDARRAFALSLAGIAVAAFAIRVVFIVVVDPSVPRLSDANAYHLLANQLADGKGYIRPFDLRLLGLHHPTAEYPPLFPAVLGVASAMGAKSVEAQRVFSAVLGTGTVVLVGVLGRRLAGRRVGVVAAAIAAVYPMLFQSDAALMSETLFVLLVTAALVVSYAVLDGPSLVRGAFLGALLGLATLTRTEGAILAVALAIVLVSSRALGAVRRRLTLAGIVLVVTVAVCVPWTIRNATTFHAFVPVSNNAGTALSGANCRLTYGGPFLGSWRSTFGATPDPDAECFGGFDVRAPNFDEADAAAAERRKGLTYARDHTRRLVAVVVPARFGRTWALWRVDQQISLATLEGRVEAWERTGTYMYWVLGVLAIVGLVSLHRRRVAMGPLLAPVVAASVATVAVYGNQRFRSMAEPVLVVAASSALVVLVRRVQARVAATAAPLPSSVDATAT